MRIDIMTLFPELCDSVLRESIIGRARERCAVEINCFQIRDYTQDKHRRVDDSPYGGGTGMLLQAQPIADCFRAICESAGARTHLIYMSPQGKTLTQTRVRELSQMEHITLLCGHYEGVDERVLTALVDEEISIGDYVLTGGELPALVVADAVTRMLPGVLRNEEAYSRESHYNGLLEYPQYTRPPQWEGQGVPEVLQNGNHALIERWQREQSLKRTLERRPELLATAELDDKDRKYLQELQEQGEEA